MYDHLYGQGMQEHVFPVWAGTGEEDGGKPKALENYREIYADLSGSHSVSLLGA